MRLNNLRASIQALTISFAAFQLPYFALVSYHKFFAFLLSYLRSLIYLLSCSLPIPVLRSSIVLLFFLELDATPSYFAFIALKIFKQALSDKFLHWCSISPTKSFCSFLLFSLLSNKINCKQIFNIEFINTYLFAGNYA